MANNSGFDWMLFFTVLSILVGLIGSIVAVVTLLDSRKTKKQYSYLLELADKNIQKAVTKEELEFKKQHIQMISDRIAELQKNIRHNIPIEAKRTVLKDRLNSQIETLQYSLQSAQQIRHQLENLGDPTPIPPDLLHAIESEISPDYVIRQKQSTLKTLLAVLTTASAILSALLPSPLDRILILPILLGALVVLALMARSWLGRYQIVKRDFIRLVLMWLSIVASIFFFFGGFFFLMLSFDSYQNDDIFLIIGTVLFFIAVSFGLLSTYLYINQKRLRR